MIGGVSTASAVRTGYEILKLDYLDAWPVFFSIGPLRTLYLDILALSTCAAIAAFAGAVALRRATESPKHQPDVVEGGVDRALTHVVNGAHD